MRNFRTRPLIAILFLFAGICQASSIGREPLPLQTEGVTSIDAEQLIQLMQERPQTILIDARITADRELGFLFGSISLPDVETDCDSLKERIPDHDHPVIFYCNGIKCGRSLVASRIAQRCGYTRLYWFRGGYREWIDKHYPVEKRD